jgi:catechol 2,3-dioxygenase-like lactoylglutathione lyase family enzyme
MKLSHVNLAVPDVGATRAFFETYFGLRCLEAKGENVLCVLTDETGFVLTLSHFQKELTPVYHPDFHVGFIRNSVAEVNALHACMQADGLEVPALKRSHGRWGFYVLAPGGISVEVASYD